MKKELLSLVLGFIINGCVFKGTIISKNIEKERRWTEEVPAIVLYKGLGSLEFARGHLTINNFDDEDYVIKVRNRKGEERTFYVKSREIYNSLKIGDNFQYDPKIVSEKDLIIRRRSEHGKN